MWAWVVCVGRGGRRKEGGGREGSVIQDLFCLSHILRVHPTQPTQHRNLLDGIHGCNRKFTRLFVSPSTLLSSQSRCLSTSLLFRSPLPTPPLPLYPPIWPGWPLWPVRSTLKCREVERGGWVRINLKWALHHPSEHLGTRPVQVVASRLIIKTLLC